MLCLLIATIPNVGHQDLTLEPSANSVVNSSWLAPVPLDFNIAIRLMTDELLGPLLDNFRLDERS